MHLQTCFCPWNGLEKKLALSPRAHIFFDRFLDHHTSTLLFWLWIYLYKLWMKVGLLCTFMSVLFAALLEVSVSPSLTRSLLFYFLPSPWRHVSLSWVPSYSRSTGILCVVCSFIPMSFKHLLFARHKMLRIRQRTKGPKSMTLYSLAASCGEPPTMSR